MRESVRSYVVRETLISVAINTVLSVLFVFLMFHGLHRVPVSGPGGLIRDAVPQTVLIALMSSLVPVWLTLRRGRSAVLPEPAALRIFRPRHFAPRAVLLAAIAGCLGVALCALILPRLGESFLFRTVLYGKALYGALEASVVTPVAILMGLQDAAMARIARGPVA